MRTMSAFVRTSERDQRVELADVPIPEIGEAEALVKVEAFGVGIHDRYFIPSDAAFPYVIGVGGSGVIAEIGRDVSRFSVGDRVILTSILQPKGGCWAEYVAVPQESLIPLPDKMDFTAGAAMPVAGKTALESLRALDLAEDDTVFIAGASGAIGTLVIQMAAARGVRVAASASHKNQEYMRSLGAVKTVDYSDPDWKRQVKQWMPDGVAAALAIQPGTATDCVEVVKDGGKVVTVSGDSAESQRGISVFQFQHHADTATALAKLVSNVAEGRPRLVLERIYPFKQALEALEKTETRHARGKLTVTMADEE